MVLFVAKDSKLAYLIVTMLTEVEPSTCGTPLSPRAAHGLEVPETSRILAARKELLFLIDLKQLSSGVCSNHQFPPPIVDMGAFSPIPMHCTTAKPKDDGVSLDRSTATGESICISTLYSELQTAGRKLDCFQFEIKIIWTNRPV